MDFDIKDTKTFVACPCNRDFPWQTTLSLVDAISALSVRGLKHEFQILTQGSQIDRDRSELAKNFLASECDRIFWIDSDMSFKPDAFLRILALSTVMPIVGASYPAKREPVREFMIATETTEWNANEYGCFDVHGFGLGFCCVSRAVMEHCAEVSPEFLDNGKPLKMIFRTGIADDGVYRSEDMHFFRLCRQLGYKVMLDPTVELGHVGAKEYRGRMLDALSPAPTQEPVAEECVPC